MRLGQLECMILAVLADDESWEDSRLVLTRYVLLAMVYDSHTEMPDRSQRVRVHRAIRDLIREGLVQEYGWYRALQLTDRALDLLDELDAQHRQPGHGTTASGLLALRRAASARR